MGFRVSMKVIGCLAVLLFVLGVEAGRSCLPCNDDYNIHIFCRSSYAAKVKVTDVKVTSKYLIDSSTRPDGDYARPWTGKLSLTVEEEGDLATDPSSLLAGVTAHTLKSRKVQYSVRILRKYKGFEGVKQFKLERNLLDECSKGLKVGSTYYYMDTFVRNGKYRPVKKCTHINAVELASYN